MFSRDTLVGMRGLRRSEVLPDAECFRDPTERKLGKTRCNVTGTLGNHPVLKEGDLLEVNA